MHAHRRTKHVPGRKAILSGALAALLTLAVAACGGSGSGATDDPGFSTPAPLETTTTETTDMTDTTTTE